MSLVGVMQLGVIATMEGVAGFSAWSVVIESVNAEEASLAWGWTALFVVTSFVAAWWFWSLVR